MIWYRHQDDEADLDVIGEILAEGDVETTFVSRGDGYNQESAAGLLFAALVKSRWAK